MDAPFVAIFTADEDRQIVERVALRSSASEPAPPPRPFRYGEGLVGLAARERRTIHVADVANDPRVVRRDYLVQERVRSVLAVPILCEEALLGVITLSRRAPFALGPEDTQTLDSFVAHAGIAIRNAQLYAESEDRRRAAEALVDVGHALTEVLDPDEVARRAVASVRRLLDAPSAALYRRTPDSADMRLLMGAHDPTAVPLDWAPVLPASGALGALSVTQRRPLWSSDVTADARFTLAPDVRARLHGAGYGAVLAVPLIAVGEAVGSIVVADRVGRTFQPRDVRLAQAFADQAAIALRNARMVDDLARTQHELAHAQKMEAVGQLAGGVAHDFNNLLTIIIGRADFVLDQVGIPPAVQRDVEIIQSAAVRAAALTRQLLAFGRKQVLRPTVLDLRDVVERMLPLLARLLPESIEVLSRHERHSAPVRGDRGQLEQVLINLAVNARDAMPSGGRLVISTAHVTLASQQPTAGGHLPPGTYAVLGVEDTGTGMAPDVQARIFEPFYTTKQIGKGTGLGLSTVYGIVSQHGGGITVDSTPGRGATFRVYLPLEESAVPAGVAAPAAPVTGGTETVLVVEDQADLRRFVREILERYGYRVLDASTPTDALALVEREGGVVDLLVTDVVMPEMSGPDTARLLRERRGRLPILYMTGYPREALETTAPAGEFLQKPFTGVDLLERVRAVLDAAGGGEAVS
jgi:signal transduction histidine kinase